MRIALCALAVLYTLAVYAPLIANDRPYRIESANPREYAAALRSLRPITLALNAAIAGEADAVGRVEGSSRATTLVEGEHTAARARVELLRRHLSPEHAALVERFGEAIDRAVGAHRSGRRDEASRAGSEALGLAERVQTECAAIDPEHPERRGVPLVLAVRYPLFESLAATDVFFMLLWACGLGSPWWIGRFGRASRGARKTSSTLVRSAAAAVVLSLAGALIWRAAMGDPKKLESTAFKRELSSGERIASQAWFPPLAMGFAETHPSEAFRPPTWARSAEISDLGFYVHGARAERRDAASLALAPAPVEVRFAEPARNSPWRHPLGTDSGGRDVLARCLWGARTSLSVGLVAALCLCAIGTLLGSVAGYSGGLVDGGISRTIEVVLCFPAFFLILMGAAVCDPDRVPPLFAVVVVISLVGWTGVARLVRAEFQKLQALDFVQAARASGFTPLRIVLRHMLPNALGPVLVALVFAIAAGILTESALSFLGFGVQEPFPSWGSILNDSHSAEHWWIQLFPGSLIFVTVLAFNVVGEGIRDALDPRATH